MTDGRETDKTNIDKSGENKLLCFTAIVLNLDLVQFTKIQGSFHVGESFAMLKCGKYVVSLQKYARISPKICLIFVLIMQMARAYEDFGGYWKFSFNPR